MDHPLHEVVCGHRVGGGGREMKGEGVKIKDVNEARRVSHEIKSMRRFHQFKQTKSRCEDQCCSGMTFFYLFVNGTAKEDKIEKKEGKQAQA